MFDGGSSHALDQRRVDALQFSVAIFTNLTGDHLDYHQDMANYAAAKARLFELLDEDGTAIVNIDDQAAEIMIGATKAKNLIRVSTQSAPVLICPPKCDVNMLMGPKRADRSWI